MVCASLYIGVGVWLCVGVNFKYNSINILLEMLRVFQFFCVCVCVCVCVCE